MRNRTKAVLVGGAVALAVIGGAGVALATGTPDEIETPITGASLQKASGAALAHIGQGRVTATEAGDEEGAYEVEVTRDDGSEVDVHLRRDFTVIRAEVESPGEDGDG